MATSAEMPLLEVRDLVKEFPGQRALNACDFDVRAGEVHALLGENGAGKSTLIKCIAGAHQPTSGSLLLDGQPVTIRSVSDARALGISVIHQQSNLVPTMSIADNLAVGERYERRLGPLLAPSAQRAFARDKLARVGLDLDPRREVGDLRPHEAAMVAVAKALSASARLIVLDEPTTALTAEEVGVLFEQVRALADSGVGFVYVSHRMAEIFQLADRITVLREGRRVGEWERSSVDRRAIIEAIVGPGGLREHVQLTSTRQDLSALEVHELSIGPCAGVSFQVAAGEVVGLAGLAGSGVDEIASSLFASPPASAGSVSVKGRPVRLRGPRDAKRAGIAMVPKDRHAEALLPGQGIRENITLASSDRYTSDPVTRWMRRGKERVDVARVMSSMRIAARDQEQDVSTLSGGNQQKVVIGRWIVEDYQVYVFVDPCAGVDVGAKAEIYKIVRGLAAKGAGIVFTSTEPEEYERVCDRVLVFRDGAVVTTLHSPDIDQSDIVRWSLDTTSDDLTREDAVT